MDSLAAGGHFPFRDWCRSCVAGRGLSEGHYAIDHASDTIPTIAIDYGYLGDTADDDRASPIIFGADSKTRWRFSHVLQSKGIGHLHSVRVLVAELVASGYARLILKSDEEPAIVALKREVARIVKIENGIEVMMEESPVGESQSNGLAEGAVRICKGAVKTLKHAYEALHGVAVEQNSPILTWLVEASASLMNRGQRGSDGRTAYELRRGKPFRKEQVPFGECVLYLPAGKRQSTL